MEKAIDIVRCSMRSPPLSEECEMPRVSRRSEVDKASSGSLEWRAKICAAMLCAAMTASEWPSYCLAATELRAVFTLDFALRSELGAPPRAPYEIDGADIIDRLLSDAMNPKDSAPPLELARRLRPPRRPFLAPH